MVANFPATSRLSEIEVLSRFAWAKRQGAPNWLWPETSVLAWQGALIEIESVTRQILHGGRCDVTEDSRPEDFGIAAYTSGMGPLLGHWLSAGSLVAPPGIEEVLALHYSQNRIRMKRLAERACRIVEHLTERGVDVTVLKGMDTAFSFFPTPGTRSTSDIDLLIPPGQKQLAEKCLREMGFLPEHASRVPDEQFWRHVSSPVLPQSLSYVHQDDPWGVDLHTSTNRRYGAGAPIIRLDDLIAKTATDRWSLCRRARTLAPAGNILFLACHAGCHFSNLRMIRLVELVFAIRHDYARREWNWNDVIDLGTQTSTLSSAYAALALADDLAPGIVPASALENCRTKAPGTVVEIVIGLSPATAHCIRRISLRERYMWTSSWYGRIRQLVFDIFPADRPIGWWVELLKIRFWKVVRGRVSIDSLTS